MLSLEILLKIWSNRDIERRIIMTALNSTAGSDLQQNLVGASIAITQSPEDLGNGSVAVLAFHTVADDYTEPQVNRKEKMALKNVAARVMKSVNNKKLTLNKRQKNAVKEFKKAGNNPASALRFLRTMKNSRMNLTPFYRRQERKTLSKLLNIQPKRDLTKSTKKYYDLKIVFIPATATPKATRRNCADNYYQFRLING